MGERSSAQRNDARLSAVSPSPPPESERPDGGEALADAAHRDLLARWRRFRTAARRVRRRTDPEAIHDARVASRRLTAALHAWEPLLSARRVERAARALRRLRRRLGEVRDLEVTLLLVQSRVERSAGEEAAAWAPLLATVAAAVERSRAGAVRRTRAKTLQELARRVRSAAESARPHPEAAIALAGGIAALTGEARTLALALLQEARGSADDARLHTARIAVKKWRYAVECARELAPPADVAGVRARLKSLEALQESLGAVHDLAVLRDLAAGPEVPVERVATARRLAASIEAERLAAVASAQQLVEASWPSLAGSAART
jgi:CHAD domain-containing protein